MLDTGNDNQAYERARKRVDELLGFYMHLVVYLVVSLGLFILDTLTPGGPWFFWPVVGWGIALLLHAASVILGGSLLGQRWEERKTRQLMERERTRGPPRPPRPSAP